MTAPIDDAYAALATLVGNALAGCGFLASAAELQVDPPAAFEPSGDETTLITAAALLIVDTGNFQRRLGGPTRRYVVERTCRVELGAAAPDASAWKTALADAETALAPLPDANLTLGGKCERLELTDEQVDDLPPDGNKRIVSFIIRLRSGDPLGRTP